MDQCPQHIEEGLWRASGTLRVKVRTRSEAARKLKTLKERFEKDRKQGNLGTDEDGENGQLATFAEKEGDIGYEEKSQLKSLDMEISDIITAWSDGA